MTYQASSYSDLNGLVAVVTGGGTGIGLMIARGLAANGAKVYITGRRKDVLDKVVNESDSKQGTFIALQLDVTNKESIMAVKKHIEEKEGKLHILVNNAGQNTVISKFYNDPSAPEHESTESLGQALFDSETFEHWSQTYQINAFSIFFVSMAFLGLLEKGTWDRQKSDPHFTSGIINITSASGITRKVQAQFAYNSSKGAASHLNRLLSTEIALKKIPVRINAIAPGVFPSELTIAPSMDHITPEQIEQVVKSSPIPANRAGEGEEIAGIAAYLASRAGCYVNGQEYVIDGGYLTVNP